MYENLSFIACVVFFAGVIIMLLRGSRIAAVDATPPDDNPFASDVFKVVSHLPGCATCGSHASWFIDSPPDLAPNLTYTSEDEAAELTLFLNKVYNAGFSAGKAVVWGGKDMDGYNRWKAEGNGV